MRKGYRNHRASKEGAKEGDRREECAQNITDKDNNNDAAPRSLRHCVYHQCVVTGGSDPVEYSCAMMASTIFIWVPFLLA